jgi:hypothetical protein
LLAHLPGDWFHGLQFDSDEADRAEIIPGFCGGIAGSTIPTALARTTNNLGKIHEDVVGIPIQKCSACHCASQEGWTEDFWLSLHCAKFRVQEHDCRLRLCSRSCYVPTAFGRSGHGGLVVCTRFGSGTRKVGLQRMIVTVRLIECIDSPSETGISQQTRRLRCRKIRSIHGVARPIPSSSKTRHRRYRFCSVQRL